MATHGGNWNVGLDIVHPDPGNRVGRLGLIGQTSLGVRCWKIIGEHFKAVDKKTFDEMLQVI